MKAILMNGYGDVDVLSYEETETPTPKADEVLIKVEAAGLNYADTMLRKGVYLVKPETPFVPGFEVAGTIESLGENVNNLRLGQRVMAFISIGGYAEFAVAPSHQAFAIPENIESVKALALTGQGWTAMGLLRDLKAGQTILIHAAAGGVGTLLVQLAKIRGAKVIGTASTSEKLELIKSLGADFAVNYTEHDWSEQVLTATDGNGVDLIIEMVGGEIGRQNLACLARRGTMIIYGQASGENFELSAVDLLYKSATVKGYILYNETPEDLASYTTELIKLVDEKRFDILVTEFPLEKAADAQRALETRKTTGKVVLKI
ncbi:MAG: quinone oxidoreductase [Pyrinomonadaceae bacterium]|nr:quinone oxidoreductase [Pyrinomonadaceae bacterium]